MHKDVVEMPNYTNPVVDKLIVKSGLSVEELFDKIFTFKEIDESKVCFLDVMCHKSHYLVGDFPCRFDAYSYQRSIFRYARHRYGAFIHNIENKKEIVYNFIDLLVIQFCESLLFEDTGAGTRVIEDYRCIQQIKPKFTPEEIFKHCVSKREYGAIYYDIYETLYTADVIEQAYKYYRSCISGDAGCGYKSLYSPWRPWADFRTKKIIKTEEELINDIFAAIYDFLGIYYFCLSYSKGLDFKDYCL